MSLEPECLTELGGLRCIPFTDSCPGVYFLCYKGKLQYIGQATNVLRRLGGHADKKFDVACYIPLPIESLDVIEGVLLRHFRPPLNSRIPRRWPRDAPDEQIFNDILAGMADNHKSSCRSSAYLRKQAAIRRVHESAALWSANDR